MDFNNNKPIYRQIIDFCFNHILSGSWKPDEKIPSVREMAMSMAVNSHTVLKAFEYLQANDIIYPRRGMGYYLAAAAPELVNATRRKEFFDETLPAVFNEMKILGITMDDILKHSPEGLKS